MLGTPKQPSNLSLLLQTLIEEATGLPEQGKVADYIPALAEVDPQQTAIAVMTLDGATHHAGAASQTFSIQSVAKIFALVLAMNRMGDELWHRVRMEPSGQAFNSIVQLEWEHGIPRNPFINAGAIVVADTLVSHYSASQAAFLSFIRKLAQTDTIRVNERVFLSEKTHGSRNAALAYLMKSFGNIEAGVPQVLDQYFYQCAIEMDCLQLARALLFLANRGTDPLTEQEICSRRDAHRVNAILSTSGMYDQSGEFAFTVGLPAKSGVGGGIAAIVPNYGVVAAWSPALNAFGNSCRALFMIRRLAEQLGLSVF